MWGCSPSKQSSYDGLVEEIDDGVRGSVCGAGIEIERDRELAERRGELDGGGALLGLVLL